MGLKEDTLYERETHLSYNDLEEYFELETYDIKLKNRFTKNKNVVVEEENIEGIGKRYKIRGEKSDLDLDLYNWPLKQVMSMECKVGVDFMGFFGGQKSKVAMFRGGLRCELKSKVSGNENKSILQRKRAKSKGE